MFSYRVFVLQNEAGRFYIGASEDVAHRLKQHNSGASRWTKGKGPWAVVLASAAMSLSDVRKLENRQNARDAAPASPRSPAYREIAHNPATAGSRVQIPPQQPRQQLDAVTLTARVSE